MILNYSVLLFFSLNVYRFCCCFTLNPSGYDDQGDPAPGRSPGPPNSSRSSIDEEIDTFIDKNLDSACYLPGPTKQLDAMAINITVTHRIFESNVLVPGISYQVNIAKWDTSATSSSEDILLATRDGVFFKEPSNSIDDIDCGPHVFRGRLASHSISVNWSFHKKEDYARTNVTFWLKMSSEGALFVNVLSYSIPISQECKLHLIPDQSTITNMDIPENSGCQVWFPTQEVSHGIVIDVMKLNVPCSKGFVYFSGSNDTHDSERMDSYVYVKSHKQAHLCGKLEELADDERHIHFPSSHLRPSMHSGGKPIFAIRYRLVDHCYNVTFVARNGSFELRPKNQLQCTFKIFLPYGNRVAMKMWVGDTTIAGPPETSSNFQDVGKGENICEGLLTQLQDGPSLWSHCTKNGNKEKQIDLVSRENKVILTVTARNPQSNGATSVGTFAMRMSYRAEPIESVVGVCEFGWVKLRQFCVSGMEGAKLPWAQAETACARKGGHLVSLRSEMDQAVLDNLLKNSPGYRDDNAYWIGASDKSHEGDFKWSDGLPFSYSNWFAGWPEHGHYNQQPNDDGLSEQDCVETRRMFAMPHAPPRLAATFMWNDRDCATANYFVCERLQSDDPLEDSRIPNCNRTVFLSRDQPKSSVSSPGFPRQYPDNANCDIEISVTPGFRIILDFEELVLENEPSCSYDYLLILESFNDSTGNDTSKSTRRICGDWSAKLKLLRHVSHSSRLRLRFSSDYSHHFGGFKARVSMENALQCADDRFVMFNNSCYLIISYPEVTWNTSQEICEGLKSNLASILTAEEEKFITTSIRRAPEYRTSSRYWLGAMFHQSYKVRWIDKHRTVYVGWFPGQAPTANEITNSVDRTTCLSIQWTPSQSSLMPSGFYWQRHRCNDKGGYICKRLRQPRGIGIDFNKTLNGSEGSLTSPNFPYHYHDNLDFTVDIRGPEKSRLVIKFSTIDIESQIQCLYDYVELESVYRNSNKLLNDATRLCGSHDSDMKRFNFVSETNEARIRFHSDYSIAGKGFSLVWYAVDLSSCPEQTLTAQQGNLLSPNHPDFLLAHLNCTITVMAPSNRRIWLNFIPSEENGLEIVPNEDFSLKLSLGQYTPFFELFGMARVLTEGSFISTGETLRLWLQTKDNPLGHGFRASYEIIKSARREKIIALGNATSGSLFHLNFPYKPPSNVDFLQHLVAPLGSTISLEIYNMKLSETSCLDEGSFIEVVDNYSDVNGTVWRLCYSDDSGYNPLALSPVFISSFLNTLHVRQYHGASGVSFNCSLKVKFDDNYKTKLLVYKDREVEACFPNPCRNGGKCVLRKMKKFCQCVGHYTGIFCALTKCELEPCVFGQCELTNSSYICHCELDYRGSACDQKRRPCESNPCESRGKCIDKGDSFQCQCHAWWEGQRCERRMTHIPYTPLSERMLHEPFWLGLMTVFVVMGVIGLVWCAKRHFPEKIEKLLAEEDTRNRRHASSLRSSSVREQLVASAAAANASATASSPSGPGPASRSLFGRLGIRKPSILSLTSPHAYEPAAARTFSLDDLLKPPPRRTPSPKKKRNNSTPVKKNVAEKRQILQQLVSSKPSSKKVSLKELIKLSEMNTTSEANTMQIGKDHETKFGETEVQNALSDPKLEKKVTFARLLNKVSAEMSSGSEMELGIMQTNRLGCMFARAASTPPSPSVGIRSPNSTSSNQDLLINRRQNRLPNGKQKPSSADSILAMFRNFSSSSAAANLSSSLKVSPSTTPTASSPQDDVAGDDDSSTSSIHTPVSFSGFMPESPLSQSRSTIEVPVLNPMNAHKASSMNSNLLHPPTILLEIPSTINKCLSPIREIATPLPSPMPSPCITPMRRRSDAFSPMMRHRTASSSLDDAEISDDRISVEIPNISISSDMDEDDIRCPDIAIDPQAEDGLILEEAAALQHSLMFRSKNRPSPIGQHSENNVVTITVDPPPLIIPKLIIQTPSPTHSRIPSISFPGSPPPHRHSDPKEVCFQFPPSKQTRKMLKDLEKPTSLDLPYAPPIITITCNLSEVESDTESLSPAAKSSGHMGTSSTGMNYLSPLSMNVRGEHTASESNLSSSGYSSMTSPGPSRCGSSNPLCSNDIDDQGPRGPPRTPSLTPVMKTTLSTTGYENSKAGTQDRGRGRSDSETLSDDLLMESNDEGIGTDHIDEKIDDGELKSAKELEVFIMNENESCKTLLDTPIRSLLTAPKIVKCASLEDDLGRLMHPLVPSQKNLQLPSIVVQYESSECEKHFSPANSRSESPLSDRATSRGRKSPQLYDKQKDLLTFTDSDGLYDFSTNEKTNITTSTYHKKPGRKREKKSLRNCKTPSPTKPPPPIFFSHLDIPSKESINKIPPLRKLSPKRRMNRVQTVSSSSSSDSVCSTAKEIKHSSSSPSPDTMRWSSPVAWTGEKCSKSAEHSCHDIQNIDSSAMVKSADFGKGRYGVHQKVSKLRAISHQIRFLRRLEHSLKKKERTISPSGSFDSEDDSPGATSPLLSTKETKTAIRKSSSIGKLQSTSKSLRGRYSKAELLLPQDNSLKVIFTGNGYSD